MPKRARLAELKRRQKPAFLLLLLFRLLLLSLSLLSNATGVSKKNAKTSNQKSEERPPWEQRSECFCGKLVLMIYC